MFLYVHCSLYRSVFIDVCPSERISFQKLNIRISKTVYKAPKQFTDLQIYVLDDDDDKNHDGGRGYVYEDE